MCNTIELVCSPYRTNMCVKDGLTGWDISLLYSSSTLYITTSFSFYFRHASIFLERGKDRIGSTYKKAMYREYTDDTYSRLAARPDWLGFLGPVLRAEVDDVIIIHLKNFANRSYSIHPHGLFYVKNTEGKVSHNEQTRSWRGIASSHKEHVLDSHGWKWGRTKH